jgi:hypothetical protein
MRTCDTHFGNIHRWDGNAFYLVATHNTPPALAEARRRSPLLASAKTAQGRLLATKTAVHITDLAADSNYIEARDPTYVTGVELGGVRTLLIVPMLREGELAVRSRFTAKKFAPSPISKSHLSRTLPPKRSSQSRMRGCSTNHASAPLTLPRRWSSRRPRRAFSRLSQALPVILNRSLQPCLRMPFASATLNSEASTVGMVRPYIPPAFAEFS